jgi:hypothetical protein
MGRQSNHIMELLLELTISSSQNEKEISGKFNTKKRKEAVKKNPPFKLCVGHMK